MKEYYKHYNLDSTDRERVCITKFDSFKTFQNMFDNNNARGQNPKTMIKPTFPVYVSFRFKFWCQSFSFSNSNNNNNNDNSFTFRYNKQDWYLAIQFVVVLVIENILLSSLYISPCVFLCEFVIYTDTLEFNYLNLYS